eukprot:scaffold254430_cov31-Tisochrysis_lutea.AAC.3
MRCRRCLLPKRHRDPHVHGSQHKSGRPWGRLWKTPPNAQRREIMMTSHCRDLERAWPKTELQCLKRMRRYSWKFGQGSQHALLPPRVMDVERLPSGN